MTTYYCIWQGSPHLMAVLVTTTRSLAQARRIVAAMAQAGQQGYVTRETGCVMDAGEREVVTE